MRNFKFTKFYVFYIYLFIINLKYLTYFYHYSLCLMCPSYHVFFSCFSLYFFNHSNLYK